MTQKKQKTISKQAKAPAPKKKKLYDQKIFLDWCKACGLCIAFCPKKVFQRREDMKPFSAHPDACIGCFFCEMHCPDFAITIEERQQYKRRKTDV